IEGAKVCLIRLMPAAEGAYHAWRADAQNDSILTNPALGFAAVIDGITAGIDYVNEWRDALHYDDDGAATAPKAVRVPKAAPADDS
ncbi:hypothetical protein INO15_13920, partial [Staphylococcus aureus]|nr:hypothetical protein [Staphylococcus aureus]